MRSILDKLWCSELALILLEPKVGSITCQLKTFLISRLGSKMVFLSFRQQIHTLQGVLELNKAPESPHQVSKQMLKFSSSILAESIVLVEGELKAPFEPIRGSTIKDVEVHIRKV